MKEMNKRDMNMDGTNEYEWRGGRQKCGWKRRGEEYVLRDWQMCQIAPVIKWKTQLSFFRRVQHLITFAIHNLIRQ